jgi:hypothetical protein
MLRQFRQSIAIKPTPERHMKTNRTLSKLAAVIVVWLVLLSVPTYAQGEAPLDAAAPDEVTASTLVIQDFNDKNLNGLFEYGGFRGNDELIDWRVSYCALNSSGSCASPATSLELGSDGTATVSVAAGNTYKVCAENREGWAATTNTCFTVQPPATVLFGNAKLPAIRIRNYHDQNGNGLWDAGEPGLDGWGFTLFRQEDPDEWSQKGSGVTTNGGVLGFTQLALEARYKVNQLPQAGWIASTATSQVVNITGFNVYEITFGSYQPATLGNFVWNDADGNGTQDAGETGIANVTVNLLTPGSDGTCNTSDDGFVKSTTTGADGKYKFTSLAPTTYCLQFVAPGGYDFSPQNQGDDRIDSDADPDTGKTGNIVLTSGQSDLIWGAGLFTGMPTAVTLSSLSAGSRLTSPLVTLLAAFGGMPQPVAAVAIFMVGLAVVASSIRLLSAALSLLS